MTAEIITPEMHEQLDRVLEKIRGMHARMAELLKNIGAGDHCNDCKAEILWVRHRNGIAVPYDTDGSKHFQTCKKRKAAGNGK